LANALREMGRIEKTIFILDYISSEAMRRKIQKGLNKGESMNAHWREWFSSENMVNCANVRSRISSNELVL
jgi:TnpA family transposase